MSLIDDINKDIIQAKNDWWDAHDRGDQAGMDAAHAKADYERDSASSVFSISGHNGASGILQLEDDAPIIISTPTFAPEPTWHSDSLTPTEREPRDSSDREPRYRAPSSSPYIPPKPAAPTAPPQGPPKPGAAPTFTTDEQQQVIKYEYVYGIKDIQIRGNEFAQKSIYVSKPILVSGNVMEVSLTSIEDHPLFNTVSGEATNRQTSVEYYIAYAENPSAEEWNPILPEGQTSIRSELLIFDSARTATLRFPALSTAAKVYRDGIGYTNWSFTSGGMKVQLLEERKPGAIYMIDYTPNAEIVNPWLIDIYAKGLIRTPVTQLFPGADHNKTITLSDYPFVDYAKINAAATFDPNLGTYKPIQVSILNSNIAGPNRTILPQVDPYIGGTTQVAYTLNITDYKTKNWQMPKAYSLDKVAPQPAFQYWNQGNKIFFSETFNKADIVTNQEMNHGNGTISVTYEKLVANFRVKIILRRNGLAANSVSPIVYQYGLKFKAVR